MKTTTANKVAIGQRRVKIDIKVILLLSFGSWDRTQLVGLNHSPRENAGCIFKPSYSGTEPIARRYAQAKFHFHKAFCGTSNQTRPIKRYYLETI